MNRNSLSPWRFRSSSRDVAAVVASGLLFFCLSAFATPVLAQEPTVEIVNAEFGKGKKKLVCTEVIQKIIADKDRQVLLTASALGLRKGRGITRDALRIRYRVDGVEGFLVLKARTKQNIYEAILAHAGKARADAEATPAKPATPMPEAKKPPATPPASKKPAPKRPPAKRPAAKPPAASPPVDPPVEVPAEDRDVEEGTTIIELPEPFAALRTGAGGRYLAMHLPEKRVLTVLDAVTGEFVHEQSVPTAILFTLSRDKLFVAQPQSSQIQRWDMTTWQREKVVSVERESFPEVMVTGAGANGLICCRTGEDLYFLDPETLERVEIKGPLTNGESGKTTAYTVSMDGSTFVVPWGRGSIPFKVIRIDEQRRSVMSRLNGNHGPFQFAIPTCDGRQVIRHDREVFNYELQPIPGRESREETEILPTDDPGLLLGIRKADKGGVDVVFLSALDLQPLTPPVSITDLFPQRRSSKDSWIDGQTHEPRVRYLSDDLKLVSINEANTRVVIKDYDVESVLEERSDPWAVVRSVPPLYAKPGDHFEYGVEVQGSADSYEFQMDYGPEGMTVDEDGVVQWDPPSALAAAEPENGIVDVSLTIAADNGFRATHSFRLIMEGQLTEAQRTTMELWVDGKLDNGGPTNTWDSLAAVHFTNIPLKGPADRARAARNGQMLIVHVPEADVLEVVDIEARQVVAEIPVPDDCLFAGNAEFLVWLSPSERKIETWSLEKLRRVKSDSTSLTGDKAAIAMGACGNQPAALWNNGVLAFIDPARLSVIDELTIPLGKPEGESLKLFPSPDGSSFTASDSTFGENQYALIRIVDGMTINQIVQAGPDGNNGKLLPTHNAGLMIQAGGQVLRADQKMITDENLQPVLRYPSFNPNFILGSGSVDKVPRIVFQSSVDLQTIAVVEKIPGMYDRSGEGRFYDGMPRVFYFEPASSAVCIRADRNEVYVRKFQLEEAIRIANADLPVLKTTPPPRALVGEVYRYQPELYDDSGAVAWELEEAPEGMTMTESGMIEWSVTDRAVGGSVDVAFSASREDGASQSWNMAVEVTRVPGRELVDGSTESSVEHHSNGKRDATHRFIIKADGYVELPGKVDLMTRGPEGALIVVCGNEIARLAADGTKVEASFSVEHRYAQIECRRDYFVAMTQDPPTLFILDKDDFSVKQSRLLPFRKALSVALHPRRAICYVAGDVGGDIPSNRFMVADESDLDGIDDPEWIGNKLAVSPDGRFLFSGFSDLYVSGQRVWADRNNWHVSPEYGSIDWLIRYKLDENGRPAFDDIHESVGTNLQDLQLSANGSRVCFVSYSGYPKGTNSVSIWNANDFTRSPTTISTDPDGNHRAVVLHPTLPILVVPTVEGAMFFDQNSGKRENRGVAEPPLPSGCIVDKVGFSSDGQNALFSVSVGRVPYLRVVPLKLSSNERKTAESKTVPGSVEAGGSAEKPGSVNLAGKGVPLNELNALSGERSESMTTAQIADHYTDSVMFILSGDSSGTGFVVGKRGYIMTCAHVIDTVASAQVLVKRGKEREALVDAEVILLDRENDLALLKIPSDHVYSPVSFALENPPRAGTKATVIGFPGMGAVYPDYTITEGVISNPDRDLGGASFIQTSAAINPGNSGGPMFDENGQVIGMVVLKARIEGAGFAVPAEQLVAFLLSQADRSEDHIGLERSWYDVDGRGPLTAAVKSLSADSVTVVRSSDGKEFALEDQKLSRGDLLFLKSLRKSRFVGDR